MNSLKQKMEIKIIPFTRMLKLELPSLAKEVIKIVEKHDPVVLQINEVYELLVAEQPQIEKLNARYGVHPLTMELKPLRDELMLYVSVMRLQLKVASKKSNSDVQKAVSIVSLAVDAHLSNLRNDRNERVVHEKIEEFLKAMTMSQELSEAIPLVGLMDLIDNLNATQTAVKRLLLERKALISKRSKDKTKVSAQSVITALKDLFKQIEVAQLKHTELDYQPLFDELNDTLDEIRNLVNIRDGYNKRKAEERKNNEESDDVINQPEVPVEETGVVMTPEVLLATPERMIHPEVAQMSSDNNGFAKDLDPSSDLKKSAALSSKPDQLLFVNGKG